MTIEQQTQKLINNLNGLTFSADGDNDEYVRAITPLIRSALQAVVQEREAGGEISRLRKIAASAKAFVTHCDSEPAKDRWDSGVGLEAPEAQRHSSDWSYASWNGEHNRRFTALREALATTEE